MSRSRPAEDGILTGYYARRRRSFEAQLTSRSEPQTDQSAAGFLRPTAAPRILFPESDMRSTAQDVLHYNQTTGPPSLPTPPSFTAAQAEARRRLESDRRAHRAARHAGEQPDPTQDLEAYLTRAESPVPLAAPSQSLVLALLHVFCHIEVAVGVDSGSSRSPSLPSTQVLNLRLSDPPYNPRDPSFLTRPALTTQDWNYLEGFHHALPQQVLEMCQRCKEKWFNMGLDHEGICGRCKRVDKNQGTHLYGAAKNMQPGDMPDLPDLSQTEEMVISRVHVSVEVCRVRGQQYKYSGHIVSFRRDTGRVYNTLPLLPRNLEVILLRPANTSGDPRLQRQLIHDFRVRRENVVRWLEYLRRNHPGYRDVEISQSAINLLPRRRRYSCGRNRSS
ncbi:hypothetical protein Egran_00009 [Elaphomyces granulatus]|uniref:DUF6570 domain-containing protein n=1 Tax=Elaphomyces granulatus TaxID=519963 RepID=A0A232M7C4_9EURO|nr:hypothetical protein Egran_00009 [Elaphomyces granulatus]